MAMVHRVAVTLIRHGLTKANQEKRYIGFSDPSLCGEGIKDLQELKQNAGYPKPDYILSSDRKRCAETAEILFPGVPILRVEWLREIHFGEWESKTYADLCQNLHYRNWVDDPRNFCPPDGEKLADFEKRVWSGWRHEVLPVLEDGNQKHVVILSHGGPIRFLLSQLAPEKHDFWEWSTGHGHGYTLIWEGGITGRCTLLREAPLTAKQNG
jgi:alpha-ribazole phosphatase